jgi:hypothetical protein
MKNPPINIGIDKSAPERCIVSVPVDIPYLKAQRETLHALVSGDTSMIPEERQEMEHLIGFMDHFIHGVFYVVAEYPTANRNIY